MLVRKYCWIEFWERGIFGILLGDILFWFLLEIMVVEVVVLLKLLFFVVNLVGEVGIGLKFGFIGVGN